MKQENADVVIVGAGPSGALAGALLAQKGYKVVILEKQSFPRFSIGESLLPQCMAFMAEADIDKVLNLSASSLGFQFKNGAAFHHAGKDTFFDFTEKFSDGPGTTYQVKRADFDKLLADKAQQLGVEIRYLHSVESIDVSSNEPMLTVVDDKGENYQISASFLLDASGFARVLPRLLNLEKPSSFPVRRSVFTHIKDGIECSDFDRNKILITVHPEQRDIWYWLIPFSDGTASIGVVGKLEQFDQSAENEHLLKGFVNQDPNLVKLLKNAHWHMPVNSITGYSADVTHLAGDNYALLGNAGEFLDPVFSSGVTIAMKSASLIVPLVDKYLQGESVDFEEAYEQPLRAGVECFKTFVSAWYTGDFQDVIFYPEQDKKVKEMISSILAGYAWDVKNPYVAQSKRRLKVLVELCK